MAAPRSTVRRDLLHDIEARAQAKWEETKAFEEDAPAEGTWDGGKYLVTFPYPYMNGRLHLGHAFSLTKAEFSVAFHRMRGEKALFPFAFHCTGMPIQAAAHKLKNEFALYGSPLPNFPTSPPEVVEGGVDAAGGAITIGWRAPTCTGGLALVEYLVLVREGPAGGEWQERARLPASAAEEGQCVARVDGLVVGSQYAFKVRTLLEGGAAGADSRPLAKSPDGKKDLKLMAAGGKAEKESKGGGGGKPKGKPQKVVAKTGGLMHQWDILRAMGLSPAEIGAAEMGAAEIGAAQRTQSTAQRTAAHHSKAQHSAPLHATPPHSTPLHPDAAATTPPQPLPPHPLPPHPLPPQSPLWTLSTGSSTFRRWARRT